MPGRETTRRRVYCTRGLIALRSAPIRLLCETPPMTMRFAPAYKLLAVALLLGGVFAVTARAQQSATGEKLPPGTKIVKIEADPPAVEVKHAYDYTQVVLRGHLNNGEVV